jgi:DNA primase
MMARHTSTRHDVERLRRDHPLPDVLARYGIELRVSGQSLVGRCPFHADGGRPNLHVYPENQRWFCYRCSVGGDAIDFIRRQERLSFLEACERLGGLPPHPPTQHSGSSLKRERRWDRLPLEEQVAMNTAATLYQHCLWREPRLLNYLRSRAIPDSVIRRCALGYADGHSLEAYLRRRSCLRTAQELGLLRKPGRGDGGRPLAEFLAGRIVVPELRAAQCIWFIGRDLREDSHHPKYLALAGERPILGLERAIGRRAVFLVEGVFDYLTAVNWKLPAFSPCGTYLPPERLGFLARAEVIYGVLDGDEAGQEAAARFGRVLGPRFCPLRLPDGCDLNDLARRPGGRQEFFRLLVQSRRQRSCEHRHEH